MVSEDFKYLLTPAVKPKSKLLMALGWSVYVLFGLLSTFIVVLFSGFWPMFAWICLLVYAPTLRKVR